MTGVTKRITTWWVGRSWRRTGRTLYHNCLVHPLCGIIWAVAEHSRAGWWAADLHDRSAPD